MKTIILLLLTTTLASAQQSGPRARPEGLGGASSASPAFEEVYELLRKNLAGVSEAELEQAAVAGLIHQLHPMVTLLTNTGPLNPNSGPRASGSTLNVAPTLVGQLFEGVYAYFRFNTIAGDIDKEFSAALKRLASTNRLRGLVLDLRFTDGDDYAAATALADHFLPPRQAMADWGDGMKHSTTKTNAVNLPIAILINHHTRGAAEAFAGILRRSDIGLLLGDNSAGQASISRTFTLKNGQQLKIATTPVKIAGNQTIPRTGLAPDIKVQVNPAEERAFLQDPYRLPNSGRHASALDPNVASTLVGTNRTLRRRLNEAELVRMQREGVDLDNDFSTGREAGPLRPPVITDPVLARAIDLLKGLSVVHPFRTF